LLIKESKDYPKVFLFFAPIEDANMHTGALNEDARVLFFLDFKAKPKLGDFCQLLDGYPL